MPLGEVHSARSTRHQETGLHEEDTGRRHASGKEKDYHFRQRTHSMCKGLAVTRTRKPSTKWREGGITSQEQKNRKASKEGFYEYKKTVN